MSNASLPPNQNSSVASEWRYEGLGHRIALRKRKNVRGAINRMLTVSNTQGFVLSDEYFDKQVYSRNVSSYLTVHEGDFAYNPYRINVGSIALYDGKEPGVVSPAYVVFHIVSDDLLPEFLFLILKSDEWIASIRPLTMSRGSVRQVLSFSDLQSVNIPLPPLPEQRRIAAVLNTIQDAIAAQEDVIAAAKTLKPSLMQRLFTYGPGREPADTKETAIGEIPARWEVTTIAALLKEPIKNGAFIRREQFGNGLPFLNVADVYKSAVANLSLVERVAGSEADQATYGLQMGDLIFVRSSLKEEGVGHCCIVGLISEPSIYDCHLMRVRLNSDSALSSFVGYFFLTPLGKQSLIARSKKTTMTTINQDGLAGALLPLPPYEEQAQIADSIWAVDEKIAAEEDRLTALDVLFKSMLHLLMTGQIRLLSDAGLLPE